MANEWLHRNLRNQRFQEAIARERAAFPHLRVTTKEDVEQQCRSHLVHSFSPEGVEKWFIRVHPMLGAAPRSLLDTDDPAEWERVYQQAMGSRMH